MTVNRLRQLPNGTTVSLAEFRKIVGDDYNSTKNTHGSNKYQVSNHQGSTSTLLAKKYGISTNTVRRYAKGQLCKDHKNHSLYTYLLEAEVLPGKFIYKIGKTNNLNRSLKTLTTTLTHFKYSLIRS